MNTTAICPQCQAVLPSGYQAVLCPKCLLQLGFESRVDPAEAATATYRPKFLIPTPEELAARFPQLEILEQIGHGGMGVVYRARQKDLDRIVALKILRSDIETDRNFSDRFQREARALARLNHPNIVTVYDFGRQDELYYFLMEYIDGTNLRQVEQTGQLTPAQALAIVPQVCGALQYAHEQGVVHRDIKPENILVLRDGRVKIADFGLAKLTGQTDDGHLTGTWQIMGTPHYMAPEQVERPTTVDHRADIYSLGVVIYEMLTGELPLGRFPAPSKKVQIDVRLDEVVLRALEKEPDHRYQRVTEVQTAVESIQQSPRRTRAQRTPLPAAPEELRQFVLNSLQTPSQALIYLGIAELVLAVLLLIIWPLALLSLVFGTVAIWTGLHMRHGEDYPLTLAGCIMSLLPLSPLWIVKLPFLIMAVIILWRDRADQAFTTVSWADSESRKTVVATLSRGQSQVGEFWNRLGMKSGPVVEFTRTTVFRALVTAGIIMFWSFAWSVYCITVSFLMLDTLTRRVSWELHTPSWDFTVGLLGWSCWLLGEVVLIRQTLRWRTARRLSLPYSVYEGPRSALATCAVLSILISLAIQVIPQIDFTVWGFQNSQQTARLTEVGIIIGFFGVLCGLCAALIGWRAVRLVTRLLLLFGLVVPGVIVFAAQTQRGHPSTQSLLMLCPILLAVPTLIWALWGTRSPWPIPASAIEVTPPIPSPPTGPLPAAQ